jgi:hypothetical protein
VTCSTHCYEANTSFENPERKIPVGTLGREGVRWEGNTETDLEETQ